MRKNLTSFQMGSIRNYVERNVLPKIGESCEHAAHVVLDHSSRGPVMLYNGARGGLIVKRYRSSRRFFNAKTAHEYFLDHGIPCARIIHTHLCLDPRAGAGNYFMVQEAVSGPSADEVENRDEVITKIGEALAFLHSHTRRTWGSIGSPPAWTMPHRQVLRIVRRSPKREQKSFSENRYETSLTRLSELRQRGGLTHAEASGLARSMEDAKKRVSNRSVYELIHGDLGPSQIIFRDGTPVFIDLDAVGFGDFAYELMRTEQNLCENDRERQLLRDSYFAGAGHDYVDVYGSAKRFYELTYHVGRANHWLKRGIKRNEEDGASHFLQRFGFHKEQLISFID